MSDESFPFCCKCRDKVVKNVMTLKPNLPDCQELIGCTQLSKEEWDNGWFVEDADGEGIKRMLYQHNCPIYFRTFTAEGFKKLI